MLGQNAREPTARTDTLERYLLVASAIAGRRVEVARGEGDEPAWTDGTTIFISAAARPREVVREIAVQASLLGAGSLAPELAARLTRPAFARRYLAVEGHRALAEHEDLLPPVARSVIDISIATRTTSAAASLALAASREPIADPPSIFGTIRPRRLRPAVERTVAEPRHLPRRIHENRLHELDDDGDGDGVDLELFSTPIGGGGALGRLLKRLFGDARSSRSGSPTVERPTHSTRRSNRTSASASVTTAAAPPPDIDRLERHVEITYPEWDTFRRVYRRDWCTVVEMDECRRQQRAHLRPDTHALRRPLARLGLELERRHRQLQGDDIDIDATVEAVVAATAGSAPDDAVYVDSLRRRRDLSVLLLLDVSGSAGEPGTFGATVHEHQRAAAAALAVALHDLGDQVALYGFRSQGRTAVHVLPVKRFGDALDARALHRLGALEPGAYTRLGAAIRHGASVLETSPTPRRLLVVLSDGFAYDHGYDGAYGEADARRALAEARRRGTGCLCLSIGAGADAEALGRVFGTAAHASLPRTEQLAGVVGPLFRAALRSAEFQHRTWQQRERTRARAEIERRSAHRASGRASGVS